MLAWRRVRAREVGVLAERRAKASISLRPSLVRSIRDSSKSSGTTKIPAEFGGAGLSVAEARGAQPVIAARKVAGGILAKFSVWAIEAYQCLAPRWVRGACRFETTCSCYAIAAINQYGAWSGWGKTLARLSKCRPPYGGIDRP